MKKLILSLCIFMCTLSSIKAATRLWLGENNVNVGTGDTVYVIIFGSYTPSTNLDKGTLIMQLGHYAPGNMNNNDGLLRLEEGTTATIPNAGNGNYFFEHNTSVTFNSDYNAKSFISFADVLIKGNFNPSGGISKNNKTLIVNGTTNAGSASEIENVCSWFSKDGFKIDGKFTNKGLVKTTYLYVNGSGKYISEGGTITTTDYHNNGSTTGYGNIKSSGDTRQQGVFQGTSASQPLNMVDESQSNPNRLFDYPQSNNQNVSNAIRVSFVEPDMSECGKLTILASNNAWFAGTVDKSKKTLTVFWKNSDTLKTSENGYNWETYRIKNEGVKVLPFKHSRTLFVHVKGTEVKKFILDIPTTDSSEEIIMTIDGVIWKGSINQLPPGRWYKIKDGKKTLFWK